jgi:uncharacterized membrane protein HdeD (DUF308 family)
MNEQSISSTLKGATGMSIGWALIMILLGFVAVILPMATGIGISVLVGWIIVFGGIAYLAYAFVAPRTGAFLWRMLVGIAYIFGGGYLAFHPGLTLASLTLLVATIFFFEGIIEIVLFFQLRPLPGTGWLLFDGIVTFLLAYLIWRPWPSSSTWAIGTLVGINLIFSGMTRLMYSMAARKTLKAIA